MRLLLYADGERRYIIAPKGLAAGDTVISGRDAPIKLGNALPLRNIPVGTLVHAVELKPGKGAQLAAPPAAACRSLRATASTQLCACVPAKCAGCMSSAAQPSARLAERSTISASSAKLARSGGAGIRPTVRGVAMNPVDHPHGGGEGKTSGGRHPVTPWGIKTKGYKTRRNKRTARMIVRRRDKK